MKIICLVKPVSVPKIISGSKPSKLMANPADMNALEFALRLKEETGGTVIVLTMAPRRSEELLKELYAVGIDDAVLVSDAAYAKSDTMATARTLSRAIDIMGDCDLIVCGQRSIDGETGQVGPALGAYRQLPCVTNCVSIERKQDRIVCQRMAEHGTEQIETTIPALVAVRCSVNTVRLPSLQGIANARHKDVVVFDNLTLDLPPNECGFAGSPTRVIRTHQRSYGKRPASGKITDAVVIKNALTREISRAGAIRHA
jgi:electron transfer flavoprotein beta subunit